MVILGLVALPGYARRPANDMPVGVCDVGYPMISFEDPMFVAAVDELGFDFLAFNGIGYGTPSISAIRKLHQWVEKTDREFLVNPQANMAQVAPGDPALYRKPGFFYQPSKRFVDACMASPRFLGFVYDELEHGIINGVPFSSEPDLHRPRIYDASGDSLQDAYRGNLDNLQVLMNSCYPGFAANARTPHGAPVVGTESVFPVLYHMFARAGMVQMYKLLKETMTPVTAAMAMGAAKQYGVQYWTSIDLWGWVHFPGHTPEDLRSALLFSYWTGAVRTYIETIDKNGALHAERDGGVELTELGRAVRWFTKDYRPAHPRTIRFEDFAPEIIIIRFEDTDWGQVKQGNWCTGLLYNAANLLPDEQTRYWIKIWHVISHGAIPDVSLNWNTYPGLPYRFLLPANNVAVYDETASDPKLFRSAKLVFLTGKFVSSECMAALEALVRKGLTVVTPSHLAPEGIRQDTASTHTLAPAGRGRWIVTDDVTQPPVREMLARYLGKPGEMRYVFGDREVVFEEPEGSPGPVKVRVRKR